MSAPVTSPRRATTERYLSRSVADTESFGRKLAARLPDGATVLLYGDLGSGKTALTRGLGTGMGLSPEVVQSPSYTLVNEYEAGCRRLVHIDLYRLEPEDLGALGLEEILDGDGDIKVVEWAERIDFPQPGAWRLRLGPGRVPGQRWLELEPPARNQTKHDTETEEGS